MSYFTARVILMSDLLRALYQEQTDNLYWFSVGYEQSRCSCICSRLEAKEENLSIRCWSDVMQKGNNMQGNLFVMPLWYNQEDWTGNEAQEDVIVRHPPCVSVMTLDTFFPLSAFIWQTDFVLWQSIPLWLTHPGIKPKVTRGLLREQKNRGSFFFFFFN